MAILPISADRPELMAIGDSLFQGVRSLSVTSALCAKSTPAQVAKALGITGFKSPDPAQPMIVDLESWVANLNTSVINNWLGQNAAYWLAVPPSPSGAASFDNLAVAGSEVWHLYDFMASDGQVQAGKEMAKLGGQHLSLKNIGQLDLSALFYGVNSRFVLNPSNNPALASATQMDWIAARKPKCLLINIGSNNGLWDMCFNAKPDTKFYFGASYGANAALPKDFDDFTQIEELATALNDLPPEVETIIFNTLARPRCVGNLMPEGTTGDINHDDYLQWYERPGSDYFDLYENRFALSPTSYGRITGAQMRTMDAYVQDINARIRTILQNKVTRRRLIFVDMYELLSKNDAKHYGDKAAIMSGRLRLTNNMFESSLIGGFRQGGFFGMDGMHPTTMGYGVMAQSILRELGSNATIDIDALVKSDSLIQDAPGKWTTLMFLWRDVRKQLKQPSNDITILRTATAAAAGGG